MAKGIACPFFVRKVSSYRFAGIKCSATFAHGETIGGISEWDKDDREKFISKYCNGCFEKCGSYQSNKERGGRVV